MFQDRGDAVYTASKGIQGMGQTGEALRFDNSDKYFYLTGAEPFSIDFDLEAWEQVSVEYFRTNSLKAAARFRPYADETCEKVFNRAFNAELPVPPLPSLSFLDPHQQEGVRFILGRKRSYLAHAPGAGKTAQAIVAGIMIPGPGQIVIIVPPSLTANWEREIDQFTTKFRSYYTCGVVGTTANKKSVAWRADFLIVPDSMLSKGWVYDELKRLKIKLLVVDEGSRFKEPTSARTKALFGGRTQYRDFSGLFQSAGRTTLLDGSPMPNRPAELWAPVYAMDPEAIDCMPFKDFGFRYCGAKMNERGAWEFKHSSHESELRERLRRRLMHVVTESELSHPERRRSMLFMNQDPRTPEMKAWEKKNLKLLRTDELSEDMSQGEIAHHRSELGRSKINWTVKYILGRLDEPTEKILVFAWHREVCQGLYDAIAVRLGRQHAALIMGGTPAVAREKAFASFQSGARGSVRVIVGNIAAMGRGHNLQSATRVVFCESSWSDELNKQCEKRTSRRGNEADFVRCEYVVVPGSMDERVVTSLFTKASRFKKVIG